MNNESGIDGLVREASLVNTPAARIALFEALGSVEVFYPVSQTDAEDDVRFRVPLVTLEDDSRAIIVYTCKDDSHLPERFGGSMWPQTLEIAASMPEVDWVIVRNRAGDWIAVSRREFTTRDSVARARRSLKSADVEELISKAARAQSNSPLLPIREALKGQELFVRMKTDGSRPMIALSRVGDIGGLIPVYTTTRRPGVTYAGMSWAAIVDLIAKMPDVNGAHVINDDDDWVIIDRDNLS